MPKSQFIDPKTLRSKGLIKFNDIEVNAYSKTIEEELSCYTKKDFLEIYYTLCAIRHFEEAISQIKTKNGYYGIKYDYKGPSHLSIGQEAAAVGQAWTLGRDDIIFGSHRGHADLIARGLRAIFTFSKSELAKIMDFYPDIYKAVKDGSKENDIQKIAEDFLFFGAMSEIFAKSTGFHKGLSGSMHLHFPKFGVYPNNAIVGASAPIATGAALYKLVHKQDGIVVANIGDGALGSGVVFESMNFSAMDQFSLLWKEKGALPIIFAISDNGYGMGGQTRGETMAYDMAARLGVGITPTQMHAERVDGNDVLAVIDAFSRKKETIKSQGGPALLDIVTYRIEGHSQSDNCSYRIEDEIDAWRSHDPINLFKEKLIYANIATKEELFDISEAIKNRILRLLELAIKAPYFDFKSNPNYLKDIMFSDKKEDFLSKEKPLTLINKEENPRYKEISRLKRNEINIKDAIFESIIDRFYLDSSLIAYGEEVREWGGISGVYGGLCLSLPYRRLFNTPISEAAIVSTAVGYAMMGGRVIIEIMFADFMARAADEIFNQLAKWRAMSGGYFDLKVILRVSVGSKYGTQHSQDWSSLVSHIPGLRVVYPVTPYDAKGLMNRALKCFDPVVFFESQQLYSKTSDKDVPKDFYEIEFGIPDVKKEGKDVTILSVGATLYRVLEAAKILEHDGIDVEVIDARSIVPFDYKKVINSVNKTKNILIVGDMVERSSILRDFASNVAEFCFKSLKNAPKVLGAKDSIAPPYQFNEHYFPTTSEIVDAVKKIYN